MSEDQNSFFDFIESHSPENENEQMRDKINKWFETLPPLYQTKLRWMGQNWIRHGGIDYIDAMCMMKSAIENGHVYFNSLQNRFESREGLQFELIDRLYYIGVWAPPCYSEASKPSQFQQAGNIVSDMLLGFQKAKIYHNLANLPDILAKAAKK